MTRGGKIAIIGGGVLGAGVVVCLLYRRFVVMKSRDPVATAQQAGLPVDIYALARVVASEAGAQPRIVQIAVAWVVVNEARRLKKAIYKVAAGPDGLLGAQNTGGEFVSTRLEPNAAHVAVAKAVHTKIEADPTGGALHFDSPRAQRALVARGAPNYTKTPEQVAARRIAGGMELVTLPGVPEEQMRFWRPRGVA